MTDFEQVAIDLLNQLWTQQLTPSGVLGTWQWGLYVLISLILGVCLFGRSLLVWFFSYIVWVCVCGSIHVSLWYDGCMLVSFTLRLLGCKEQI